MESDAEKVARLEQEVTELRLALTPFADAGRHVHYPELFYSPPFAGHQLIRAYEAYDRTAPPPAPGKES